MKQVKVQLQNSLSLLFSEMGLPLHLLYYFHALHFGKTKIYQGRQRKIENPGAEVWKFRSLSRDEKYASALLPYFIRVE
jgi:hypothetical protein